MSGDAQARRTERVLRLWEKAALIGRRSAEERERLEALADKWEKDAEYLERLPVLVVDLYAAEYRIASLLTLRSCAHDLRRALAAEAAA